MDENDIVKYYDSRKKYHFLTIIVNITYLFLCVKGAVILHLGFFADKMYYNYKFLFLFSK